MPIRSIIVPTDFSEFSEAATQHALRLATIDQATLHLIHSVRFPLVAAPHQISVPAAAWEGVRRAASERLEQVKKSLEERGTLVTAEISEIDDPSRAIVKAVEDFEADLIVMGTHGSGGLRHAFLGSVTERTLRMVHTPVVAVKGDPAQAEAPIERIVLAVDFSTGSDAAVELCDELAAKLGAHVDLVHAIDVIPPYLGESADFAVDLEQKLHNRAIESLAAIRERLAQNEISVSTFCTRGHPSVVIASLAEKHDAQLVVMGTRGHTGLRHLLLGSVAERTLRGAPCSVLVVPPRAH